MATPRSVKVRAPWLSETTREWGTRIRMSDEIISRTIARWPDYSLPGSGKPISNQARPSYEGTSRRPNGGR